jgi:hypothetical protein
MPSMTVGTSEDTNRPEFFRMEKITSSKEEAAE